MPLLKAKLVEGLRKFMDSDFSSFKEFPQKEQDAIDALAAAVDAFASNVIPMSTMAAKAKKDMGDAMAGLGDADNAMKAIQKGFAKYAETLASGMKTSLSPAGTITKADVPIGDIQIKSLEDIGLNGGASADVADMFGTIADAWFRTGLITVQPPGSVPPITGIPWS